MKIARWLMVVCLVFAGAMQVEAATTRSTIKVVFLGAPADGDTITVNGEARTFVGTVAAPSTEILIGADESETANNFFDQVVAYPFDDLDPAQQNTTNVFLIGDTLNVTHTGSTTSASLTVTAISEPITQFSVIVPFEAMPVASYRTNMADYLIDGMDDYASIAFPAASSALANHVNLTEAQTVSGAKTFSGATVVSNSAAKFELGAITNATIKRVRMDNDNANPNGFEFYSSVPGRVLTLAPDASGYPTFYDTSASATPSTLMGAVAPPSGGSLLWRASADLRYGQLGTANTWTASNTFSALAYFSELQGNLTNVNAGVSNLWSRGGIYGETIGLTNSSTAPYIHINDPNALWADDQNIRIYNSAGDFKISAYTSGDSYLLTGERVENAGEWGQLTVHVPLVSEGYGYFLGPAYVRNALTAGTSVGVGSTNVVAPTSLSAGFLATNSTMEASADPLNGWATWSYSGQIKYRTSETDEGAGANNRLHNRGDEVVGAGSDYNLTASYALVTFGTTPVLELPSDGTYLVGATVTIDAGAADGDLFSAKLYNVTGSADIAGSENSISNIPTSERGQITLHSIVTVAAPADLQLMALNSSSPRGSVDSEQTKLWYVRLH